MISLSVVGLSSQPLKNFHQSPKSIEVKIGEHSFTWKMGATTVCVLTEEDADDVSGMEKLALSLLCTLANRQGVDISFTVFLCVCLFGYGFLCRG